jgi:hypothetical protein
MGNTYNSIELNINNNTDETFETGSSIVPNFKTKEEFDACVNGNKPCIID